MAGGEVVSVAQLYDITLPEPTANEVKMLKAELEKFTKVEVKANAYCWMR